MRWQVFAVGACAVLYACSEHDLPDDETDPLRSSTMARIASAEQALEGAYIPTLDPQTMNAAEISKVLGRGSHCAFRYTSAGRPVLAIEHSAAQSKIGGLVKLNGHLVPLQKQSSGNALLMAAGDVNLRLTFPNPAEDLRSQAAETREADLQFVIDHRLRVGYRGYYGCTA